VSVDRQAYALPHHGPAPVPCLTSRKNTTCMHSNEAIFVDKAMVCPSSPSVYIFSSRRRIGLGNVLHQPLPASSPAQSRTCQSSSACGSSTPTPATSISLTTTNLTCACGSKEDIRCGVTRQSVRRHRFGVHAHYPTEHRWA
jgi:hypothetical protein